MDSFYAALALVCLSVPGLVFRSVSSAVSLSHLLLTLPYSRWLGRGAGGGRARVFELGWMIGGEHASRVRLTPSTSNYSGHPKKYFYVVFSFFLGGGAWGLFFLGGGLRPSH